MDRKGAQAAAGPAMISGRQLVDHTPGPVSLAVLAVLAVTALAALRYLDQHVAQAGLWIFLGLTLTTGFFHGALDIVLLQREFSGTRRLTTAVVLYAGSAMLVALVGARSGWLLILLLLVMSVWHFGEPYGRWEQGLRNRLAWVQRIVAGGAPVMLPVLLSPAAVQAVLPAAVALDAPLAFGIWQTLAWLWVGVCCVGLAAFRRRLLTTALVLEVVLVFASNLLLSPLMAFSIYFGVLHASAHILRVAAKVRRGEAAEGSDDSPTGLVQPTRTAVVVTCFASLVLLIVLIGYLRGMSVSAGEQHGLLNAVIVALTAVTLPHLVLVSRHARWLGGARSG
ncbi:Brp/Blh family beta-carotene 15,15'-dioxygenase [Actimicrobium antarcticum]